MKRLILLLPLIFSLNGCDRLMVENQINAKEIEIRELKEKNTRLINEVKDLTAQVARLTIQYPKGAMIEELRKSLTRKKTELQQWEERIVREQSALRLMQERVSNMQLAFYTDTGEKMEEIGEARQIRKEYATMQGKVKTANERANNWLIYISVLGIGFFLSLLFFLLTTLKYRYQQKNIGMALKYVDDVVLDDIEKARISRHFDGMSKITKD